MKRTEENGFFKRGIGCCENPKNYFRETALEQTGIDRLRTLTVTQIIKRAPFVPKRVEPRSNRPFIFDIEYKGIFFILTMEDNMKITLLDGDVKDFENGLSIYEMAKSLC